MKEFWEYFIKNEDLYYVIPKTRTEWWIEKINKTIQNDKKNNEVLTDLGWNVRTVWECELKPIKRTETLNFLLNSIL